MYRRRRFFTGSRSTRAIARNALALSRRNSRLVSVPEFKQFIANGSIANVDTTGSIAALTNISQGDDLTNREGRTIRAKSLWVKFRAVYDVDNSPVISYYRVMIILDTEQRGTDPGINDILESSGGYLAFRANKYKRRFVSLYDKVFWLDGVNRKSDFNEFYKRMNIPMDWSSATSTDKIGNHIFLVAISSDPVNGPSLGYRTCLKYTDV